MCRAWPQFSSASSEPVLSSWFLYDVDRDGHSPMKYVHDCHSVLDVHFSVFASCIETGWPSLCAGRDPNHRAPRPDVFRHISHVQPLQHTHLHINPVLLLPIWRPRAVKHTNAAGFAEVAVHRVTCVRRAGKDAETITQGFGQWEERFSGGKHSRSAEC